MTRHIWGFDVWSGLPAPSKEDLASAESIATREFFASSSIEQVLSTLKWYGFDNSEISNAITLVEGLFSETLPNYGGLQIALLHIDADLYHSYRNALGHLWPKIDVGGVVAFDEYHQPDKWPGDKQAVDEFLGELASGSARLETDTIYERYYAVKIA